jgi:hypothetical protein
VKSTRSTCRITTARQQMSWGKGIDESKWKEEGKKATDEEVMAGK